MIIVSAPTLALSPRVGKAQEPVRIEALGAELPIQALDERVVGRLARAGEVERDVVLIRPQVEIAGDKLAPLVDADHARIAHALLLGPGAKAQTVVAPDRDSTLITKSVLCKQFQPVPVNRNH